MKTAEEILEEKSNEVAQCSFEDLVNDGEDSHKTCGIGLVATRTAIEAMHEYASQFYTDEEVRALVVGAYTNGANGVEFKYSDYLTK